MVPAVRAPCSALVVKQALPLDCGSPRTTALKLERTEIDSAGCGSLRSPHPRLRAGGSLQPGSGSHVVVMELLPDDARNSAGRAIARQRARRCEGVGRRDPRAPGLAARPAMAEVAAPSSPDHDALFEQLRLSPFYEVVS